MSISTLPLSYIDKLFSQLANIRLSTSPVTAARMLVSQSTIELYENVIHIFMRVQICYTRRNSKRTWMTCQIQIYKKCSFLFCLQKPTELSTRPSDVTFRKRQQLPSHGRFQSISPLYDSCRQNYNTLITKIKNPGH